MKKRYTEEQIIKVIKESIMIYSFSPTKPLLTDLSPLATAVLTRPSRGFVEHQHGDLIEHRALRRPIRAMTALRYRTSDQKESW